MTVQDSKLVVLIDIRSPLRGGPQVLTLRQIGPDPGDTADCGAAVLRPACRVDFHAVADRVLTRGRRSLLRYTFAAERDQAHTTDGDGLHVRLMTKGRNGDFGLTSIARVYVIDRI